MSTFPEAFRAFGEPEAGQPVVGEPAVGEPTFGQPASQATPAQPTPAQPAVAEFEFSNFEVVSNQAAAQELERSRVLGYSAGFAAGSADAAAKYERLEAELTQQVAAERAAAQEKLSTAMTALNAAIRAAAEREAPVVDLLGRSLLERALELAEHVVTLASGEPSADFAGASMGAAAAARRALEAAPRASQITLRVHPADAAELRSCLPAVAAQLVDTNCEVELISDDSLTRGSALAQYPGGFVDATLEAAFVRMRAALLERTALLERGATGAVDNDTVSNSTGAAA